MQEKTASPHREPSRTADANRAPGSAAAPRFPSSLSRLQHNVGNHAMHRLIGGGVLQPKLTVNHPADEYEREADRVADQVMRMSAPSDIVRRQPAGVQRRCAKCEEEHRRPDVQAMRSPSVVTRMCAGCEKEAHDDEPTRVHPTLAHGGVPEVSQGLSSYLAGSAHGGQPLSAETRAHFEPRFGSDLGHVRVHADTRADAAAREIDALAFAHGSHIHFAHGRFEPRASEGQRLLAHELAHVLFHQPSTLRRQPYTTKGIDLTPANIEAAAIASYWKQKTVAAFKTAVEPRLKADPEEQDAVYSTLWALKPPTTVTARKVLVVPIAARKGPTPAGSKTPTTLPSLLYKFTFEPPAKKGELPELSIELVASGPATKPVAAPAVPSTFTVTQPTLKFSGFPGTGTTAFGNYFKSHPDEHKALFHFLETATTAGAFDHVVTTQTVATKRGASSVTHTSVLHVTGNRAGTTLTNLEVHLISQGTIEAEQTVAADYQSHDRVDLEIERLQARSKVADRLGTVTLPPGVPREERQAIKYAIWQYFDSGNARNTEVDAIVPVGTAAAGRRILYTLTFGAANNVSVIRVGEAGTGTGKVDMQRVDVTRVRGFPGTSAAPATLQSWWAARYRKGGALSASSGGKSPTAATLIADMNRLITAGIATPKWFQDNYNVEVLDAAGTAARMHGVHGAPKALLRDTVNFSAGELLGLELSLQTLDDREIPNLKDVRIGRKHRAIDRTKGTFVAGSAATAGVTFSDSVGSARDTTILYFDRLSLGDASLFTGSSAANARPASTLTFLHELGHAVEPVAGTAAAFTAWLRKNPQVPMTWYAASSAGEVFPEAYALYHGDPHFLCNAAPLLFAWLDVLATTGAPPAAGATLTAPAKCP